MLKATGLMAVSLLLVSGCGEEGPWVGTYEVQGTWKLSGPFEGGKTVGEATAELLVDKVAGSLPAPSFVESKVRDWLEGSVGGKITSAVDAAMPPDLAPDGKLTKLLGQTLAAVDVESTLTLEGESGGELEGTETVTALEYVINGKTHRVAAAELGVASIEAPWSGEESTEGELSINRHSVAIRFGELVRLVLGDLVQAAELSALESDLKSALACKAIVAAMLDGGSGLKISVVGWDHTVSAGDLESICASVISSVEDKALGKFEIDSRVEVGGTVLWSRMEETDSIKLQSAADFGGIVNIAPEAIAPKMGVAFSAIRR